MAGEAGVIELPQTTEDRYTEASAWCQRPELWHSYDQDSPEEEVLEFVAGLVRMMKPSSVLVANSGPGRVVEAIGVELARNDHGFVAWVEPNPKFSELTEDQVRYLSRVEPWEGLETSLGVELLFIDSRPPKRAIQMFESDLVANAVVIIHDTKPGGTADQVAQLEVDRKLIDVWNFATPRGLTLARLA